MTDTTVDVTRDGSTAILRIDGEITGGSEPPIMAAYAEAGDARSIVLDFSQLADYMNSGGIGLLVTLLVRTQRANQKRLAVGLSDHYKQILGPHPPRRGDLSLRKLRCASLLNQARGAGNARKLTRLWRSERRTRSQAIRHTSGRRGNFASIPIVGGFPADQRNGHQSVAGISRTRWLPRPGCAVILA